MKDLMHRQRTPEEDKLYQLLITLIEKFEQEYYQPSRQNNLASMLLFILEESERSRDDLVSVLGTEDLVDNILNGQEKINIEQARKLGEFFNVDSSLFIE
ncbi:hypothetical protein [Nostoc sp. LPT]|uniref:helix-turn-helix domain-containing protein n=1 Tax=Nostoc sp. LPT TaxID=2815387 RepID=UPI0025F410B0|nr:hypothetical protein [Nostoc sp. LPT]